MASQWDAYIKSIRDNAQGCCEKAIIIGLNGGGSWISETCPGALKISAEEAAVLAKAFSRKKYDDFRVNGIRVGGKRYIFLRTDDDDRIVIARCKDETLTLQKTKTALIIAFTPSGKQPGNTNTAVNTICTYLRGQNM